MSGFSVQDEQVADIGRRGDQDCDLRSIGCRVIGEQIEVAIGQRADFAGFGVDAF
jgi:hypothetical protein